MKLAIVNDAKKVVLGLVTISRGPVADIRLFDGVTAGLLERFHSLHGWKPARVSCWSHRSRRNTRSILDAQHKNAIVAVEVDPPSLPFAQKGPFISACFVLPSQTRIT